MSELIKSENKNTELAQGEQVAQIDHMQIISNAVEKGLSVDMVERLMALKERGDADNAKKLYLQALSQFQAECPVIKKGKYANFGAGKTAYSYVALEDVVEQIKPLLKKLGITFQWKQNIENSLIHVTCRVSHAEGHSEETTLCAASDTSGSKSAIQAMASTVSYLSRYTLMGQLGIVAAGEDQDGRLGIKIDEFCTEQQAKDIDSMAGLLGKSREEIIAFANRLLKIEISEIADLSKKQAETLIVAINKRAAQNAI